MALVKDIEKGIETVGQLIASLQRFPADMPVCSGLDDALAVYREQPQKGELAYGTAGRITVEGDDGTWDC